MESLENDMSMTHFGAAMMDLGEQGLPKWAYYCQPGDYICVRSAIDIEARWGCMSAEQKTAIRQEIRARLIQVSNNIIRDL